MRAHRLLLPAIIVGAAAAGAFAQPGTWMEWPTATSGVDQNHTGSAAGITFGDAGEGLTNFNITAGDGPLTTIRGRLVAFNRPQATGGTLRSVDADLFCIRITDPAIFSATAALASGGNDPILSLFRLNGEAVAFNDNRTDSLTSTGARLINNGLDVNNNPVTIPGLTAGDYLLGVSRADGSASVRRFGRPIDASGNLIFPGMTNGGNEATDPLFPTRRADLGPITPGTILAGWELFNTTQLGFNGDYTITLTGVGYSDIPAPGAAAILGLGLLAAGRRRR